MERSRKEMRAGATAAGPVLGKLTVSGGKRLGATFAFAAATAPATAAFLFYLI
jgi:hypothetical protein